MNHDVNEHWRTQLLRAIEARENKAKAMDNNAEADKARWGAIALREVHDAFFPPQENKPIL